MREDFSRTVERITAGSLRVSYNEMLSKAKASIIRLKGHFPHYGRIAEDWFSLQTQNQCSYFEKGIQAFSLKSREISIGNTSKGQLHK